MSRSAPTAARARWKRGRALRADIGKLRRALGSPKSPKEITQEPYEGNPRHLRRLARGDWRTELPKSDDLFDYIEDINWCDVIQPDLFRYMLPVLLEMWRQDLMRETLSGDGNVDWFYNGLACRGHVKNLLGDKAEQAAGTFMRNAILDRIDNEQWLSHKARSVSPQVWISALASLGIIFPEIKALWQEWWSLETSGQARALLQYSSVLLYEYDNPLFRLFAPDDSGPPLLWEPEGEIYEKCWLPENVEFLRSVMTVDYVEDGVLRAVEKLREIESVDLLDCLVADLKSQRPILERRIAALPDIFAQHLHDYYDWESAGI